MATNNFPFGGLPVELGNITAIRLEARESAGGVADIIEGREPFGMTYSDSFHRTFRRGVKKIAMPGTFYAGRLTFGMGGVTIWKTLQETIQGSGGILGIRQTIAATRVHVSAETQFLSEEAGAPNRFFCLDAKGMVHTVELSRTKPGLWCFSTPGPHDPAKLGGEWREGTVVLVLVPDKK